MKNSLFLIFNKFPNLLVSLSKKQDGSMKLTGEKKFDKKIIQNQKNFLKKLKININSLVRTKLAHKEKVKIVNKKHKGKIIPQTDGLLTKEKNLFLSITVADCLPIFLYDPQKEIVGLVHCSWRNLAKNILFKTVIKLKKNLKSQPKDILVGIGPGISQCHFEIGEDVALKFKSFYPKEIFLKKDKKIFLNLKEIAKIQLLRAGIKKENIEINPECTFCLKNKYFSWRREKPKILKAMMAVIGLKA